MVSGGVVPKSLKLYLKPSDPTPVVWFRRPDGSLDSLPGLRPVAFANLMRVLVPGPGAVKYAVTDCVIDTGAYFSIIAEDLWRQFVPGFVTPLPFDARTPPALRSVTIGGGTFSYELGELTIRLEDRDHNHLTVTFIAKLAQDGGRLSSALTLGLRGGVLDGRVLHAAPDPAAPHGQAWSLAGP
jgi:hypothetical protein